MQTTFDNQTSSAPTALESPHKNARSGTAEKNYLRNLSHPGGATAAKRSVSSALIIGLVSGIFFAGAWLLGLFAPLEAVLFATRWTLAAPISELPILAGLLILPLIGLAVGFLIESERARDFSFYLLGFFAFWFVGGIAAAQFLQINILAVEAILTAGATAAALQFRFLQKVEQQLTLSVRRLAMSTHLIEGRRAEARLTSGLQLLSTVLPLDEIVVFKLDQNNQLVSVERNREVAANNPAVKKKHVEWRQGVDLCEEAIQAGAPVTQPTSGKPGAMRVAVPLVHENCVLGALLVRFEENYEEADKNVLTAFASQFARNFQRQETRRHDRAISPLDIFSTDAAEHRLESFRLVSGLLTEQQFGSLAFAEMVDGYAIAYLDGTLAYVNRAMLKSAQITSDRAKQLDLFSLLERFKGGTFNEPRIAVRRVMQTEQPFRHEIHLEERNQILDLQITLVHEPADGKSVHETQAVTNTPLCFIVTARDITAEKENERLRSDMVSLMSHELRTPITSINGFAELLMLEEGFSEEAGEFLRIISNESQRLSRMVNTFLAVSKLEQGDKREVIKIPIRLDTVVHEVLMSLQPDARKKRIRLVEQANAHLPPVAGDKGLMTKVAAHLIDNAIRYSPERTTITISTILESDSVRVIVEDRGYGIPADSIEKIWEKFYRVPREGQDKNETSTGLGLSFVKEVVEQHGGAVFVESEVNQGSKFSFTLPRL